MSKKNKKRNEQSESTTILPNPLSNKEVTGGSIANNSLVHIACLVVLILIIYANAFNVPFQWDEEMHIVNEPIIKDLHYFIYPAKARGFEHYNFFISRYIPHLTFALNYRIHGLSVTGYHIVNIAIHIANAILVYLLVLLTFRTPFMSDSSLKQNARFVAFFSSLLFAAHPLQTGAVTYVMQRFASLAAFFYLLSLTAYIQSRLVANGERQKGKGGYRPLFVYCISFISAVLAMKTKENAFTLPFVMTMYEFCFFNGGIKKRMLFLAPILLSLCIIPLTIMSMTETTGRIGSSLVDRGSYMAGFTWDYSREEYFVTQFRVIVTYLRLLFFPANLGLDYEYPVFRSFLEPQVFMSFVFLAVIFAIGVYMVKGKGLKNIGSSALHQSDIRLIGFGILWFFITLAVESSIITTPRLIEIYRVYLPSVGAIVSTATGLFLLKEKVHAPKVREGMLVMLVIATGALSVATYLRNEVYGDKIRMWEETAKRFPANATVHYNLGIFYAGRNMIEKAIEQYLIAIKLTPDFVDAHYNLGNTYRGRNMPDKAIEQYVIAIKLEPDYAEAHNNLGTAYQGRNMPDKAIEQYLIAIKLKPEYAEAHNNLGTAYQGRNMPDKAIEQYLIAIKLKPEYAEAHNNLGTAYRGRNMPDKAIEQYLIAIKLKPDFVETHYNLGFVYSKTGQMENARRELITLLKIKPDDQQAQQFLELLEKIPVKK